MRADELAAQLANLDDSSCQHERFVTGVRVLDSIDETMADTIVGGLADVAPDMAEHIVSHAFGEIYGRPGLPPRDRQLVTLGILITLGGCEKQLEMHIRAALQVGISVQEIVEAFMHSAVYCGYPRVLNATDVLKKVLRQDADGTT